MAKVSMKMREKKRTCLVKKYATKRTELRAVLQDQEASFDDKMAAQRRYKCCQEISAAARQRNRCRVTGRPHGVYRKFGLCRNKLREAAMRGDIPGLVKASW